MILTSLDYIFIVLYFTLVFIVAYITSRKATEEEFLIAKRKLGLIGAISTINATKTGSILLIFTALLYLYGFSAMWYFIGVAVGYLIFIPFATKLHRKHGEKHYTLASYYFDNYGKLSGTLASILNIFISVAFLVLNFIASSKVLSFFSGLSFETSTLIVAVFVASYLLMGGFKAVITTDVIQYGAIIIIFLIFAFTLLQGITIPAAEWNLGSAGIVNILGFFLIGGLLPFASPELWQRVYAIKDRKTLRQSIFYSVIVYLVVAFLLALIGLAIKTRLPNIDPDIALIHGFVNLLPSGLAGLAVVIFFAAFMSTIDTYAYTASSSLVQDLFKKLSKKQTVLGIKIAIILFIILSSVIAILIQDLILGAFIFVGYAVTLAIPTIASWIKPKINKTTLNTSIIIGGALLTAYVIYGVMTSGLTPTLVLVSIGSSLIGLIIGAFISKIKKSSSKFIQV